MPAATTSEAIRPSKVNTPEADLTELRRRINATRWPERETVTDDSQGVPLAMMQELALLGDRLRLAQMRGEAESPPSLYHRDRWARYIHFIHVRSKHENALPLIVNHGWPGSIIEQLKIIDPLINPTAHGASASDAFDLVIPPMPAYGFSGKPTKTGWAPSAWAEPGQN